ncbi:hypothetical protein RQP52_32555 [Paenibacillus sp. PFR10]|uniref:Uncharacterized protein n=1 Tax=Paenibacillus violae TaxID=3077234 RepID=A0ABU3RNF2_9BACL|nr:hypothetical protein [Paenibacillus sp. PFR10]MDU0205819.1 hypothetical protein [Paenibacillus sp. PFR10]
MEMKPSSDPLKAGIWYIKQVVGGNSSIVEEYFNRKKNSSEDRYVYHWPELVWVRRNDINLYHSFLLKLSLEQRRFILLREEIIGFTLSDLYDCFGIPKDRIAKFLGRYRAQYRRKSNKKSPKNRDIVPPQDAFTVDDWMVSFLAMLARVPPSWLVVEEPKSEWTTAHFQKNHHLVVGDIEFVTLLQTKAPVHDVIPVVLKFRDTELLFRLEQKGATFLLEYADTGLQLGAFEALIKLIRSMIVKIGLVRTIIPNQMNLAIIGGEPDLITPPEFIEVDLFKST